MSMLRVKLKDITIRISPLPSANLVCNCKSIITAKLRLKIRYANAPLSFADAASNVNSYAGYLSAQFENSVFENSKKEENDTWQLANRHCHNLQDRSLAKSNINHT